ncbi:MAG: hypothetical protein R3F34_13500 [Planctomycetota bacterium]
MRPESSSSTSSCATRFASPTCGRTPCVSTSAESVSHTGMVSRAPSP